MKMNAVFVFNFCRETPFLSICKYIIYFSVKIISELKNWKISIKRNNNK